MDDLEKMGSAAVEEPAAEPKEEAGAVEVPAPKRRGRPPGGGKGSAGGAKAAEPGQGGAAAEAGSAGAVDVPAAPTRRGSKAAALAARQAEEEALELQQLTAPHIPDCSPEWQQFYLKVRRVANRGQI